MKGTLKNYRQSPRKVRLVARELRGMRVGDALNMLRAVNKKVAEPMRKLIASAAGNASGGKNPELMRIAGIAVDQGTVMKRYRPRARGQSSPIRKRTSTVRVELQEDL